MHVEDIKIPGDTTLAAKMYIPEVNGIHPGLLLCHGFASCKEEYMALPHQLCQQGWNVLTFDFSGHGESTGHRAYVDENSHLDDTLRAYQTLIDRPEVDINNTALLGHSLGTSAVLRFLGTPAAKLIKCSVLMAPMAQIRQTIAPLEKSSYNLVSTLARPLRKFTGRHMYIPYRVKPKDLYESPEAIARAETHKLLQKTISVHNYTFLMERQDSVLAAEKVSTPTLVIAAEKDQLIPVSQSQAVFDALAGEKAWKVISGSGHSMMGDRKAKEVTSEIIGFLQAHLDPAKS